MTQQGDIHLFQTLDDGDIEVENGLVTMTGGLETAAYISLFGGNEDDDGRDKNPFNWWANLAEPDPARNYRSETQNLLQALPATANNLRRIEDAARRDLAWMVEKSAAASVEVTAHIPAINTIKIKVLVNGDSTLEFIENWKAAV